ncbi:MAG: aminotransferase class III-fold pyridoxal phosphate-dependent enzyme [Bacteroidota bacterium]
MISISEAEKIALEHYGIIANAIKMPGDEDENFKLETPQKQCYILKIAQTEASKDLLIFQNELLAYLAKRPLDLKLPKLIPNTEGNMMSQIVSEGKTRNIRMLSWVDGRLWVQVNPKTGALRYQLGKRAGSLATALKDFTHEAPEQPSDWNLAFSLWTKDHLNLFSSEERELVTPFQEAFIQLQECYQKLPKSVIHNDINNYNILVSEDLIHPEVVSFIDFGDAVHTQTINDLAILLAYAITDVPDPLDAAIDVLKGYQTTHPLTAEEIKCIYTLTGMRLITTVTKSAIRKAENSNNDYHLVSEKPAWEALRKWALISSDHANYSFRNTAGLAAHREKDTFHSWAKKQDILLSELFPTALPVKNALQKGVVTDVHLLDMKVSSTWIGNAHEFNNLPLFTHKIEEIQKEHPTKIIANGYLEPRPVYTSAAYDKEGNTGPESRTVHLGVDFWLPAGTAVHALFDAEIYTAVNDAGYKEYGGLIILKHHEDDITFYTLHGHLTADSPSKFKVGDRVKKGDCIGHLGTPHENGSWSPHLHFQIMLSMLDYKVDFPGVCYPNQISLWKDLCPDPNLWFKNEVLVTQYDTPVEDILDFRKNHLGKGLSISYEDPLHMVRGDGAYLMDSFGRKYLDTVNNVAHVGHEHPRVVKAGQKQMAVLNTNTRYLNEEINSYAKALLKKLPEELSVLHFLNSGSEANELAIRMAKTATGRNDMLAIEIGYHGNTNAVMEVSSYKFDGKGGKGKPDATHILPMPDGFRGIFQGAGAEKKYAEHAKKYIENLPLQGKEIAAFIGEPIISCGGQIVPPPNYFKEIYRKVRAAGGLCIADEVQTGFGRVGSTFWAFQWHEVVPDIVTLGKPAGNGHPLAVVACTRSVADAFANGMEFFNTFGGNPVSMAIGRTVLDVINDENLQQKALQVGSFLKSELINLQSDFPIIGDVRGEGLFLGFELVDSEKNPLAQHASYLANRMKDFKILMSTDGPDHNVLKIKPPLVFNKNNAEHLIHYLRKILKEDFMTYFL